MRWRSLAPLAAVAVVVSVPAEAKVYLTLEQAQAALLPNMALTAVPCHLTDAQKAAIEAKSGVTVRNLEPRVWRAADGTMLVVDEVIGKHEYITYAVAIAPEGAVRGIEIMEYRESYGYEVREASWRQQFVGKTAAAPLKLDGDIRNIGGATLSCKHITDGVRRVLAMRDVALK